VPFFVAFSVAFSVTISVAFSVAVFRSSLSPRHSQSESQTARWSQSRNQPARTTWKCRSGDRDWRGRPAAARVSLGRLAGRAARAGGGAGALPGPGVYRSPLRARCSSVAGSGRGHDFAVSGPPLGRRRTARSPLGHPRAAAEPLPSKRRAITEPPKSRPRAAVANYATSMAKTCKNKWSINTTFKNTMFR